MRALYNRAVIHANKGNVKAAIADITRVAEAYPELPSTYFMRAGLYKQLGQLSKAESDYKHAEKLAKAMPTAAQQAAAEASSGPAPEMADDTTPEEMSDDMTRRRFASLVTVDDNADFREEYNNSAIRGRVQDRNLNIEIEPVMLLSFYTSPTELRRNTYYIREVDDLNATRSLRFVLMVTNAVPTIDEATAARHFQSVEYYNSYLASHTPRPVDYIGRALDFITVRDYGNALKDADRAIDIAPDLALAYLVRAQARYGRYLLGRDEGEGVARQALVRKDLDDIAADYKKVLELSPRTPVAYFNLGNIYFEMEDYDNATEAYNRAIDLKPDFGEAYYNRGYIALRNGHRSAGVADLSKAGELGIVPAYNLIKRISQ